MSVKVYEVAQSNWTSAVNRDSVMSALGKTGFDGYLALESIFHFNYSTEALIKYVYDNICALESIVNKNHK